MSDRWQAFRAAVSEMARIQRRFEHDQWAHPEDDQLARRRLLASMEADVDAIRDALCDDLRGQAEGVADDGG